MNSTSPSPEQKHIITILHRFFEQGVALSKRETVTRDSLQTWNSLVRHTFYKIWGEDDPQISYFASLPKEMSHAEAHKILKERSEHLQRIIQRLETLIDATHVRSGGKSIFIGHGRSLLWLVLKDFIVGRLRLPCEEFNRASVAGYTILERLEEMLSEAAFAFLVMTAEEEHADSTLHARSNVIHEVGLFQGRLGVRRAIVLLEEGCSEFSNIAGEVQIRFPKGNIAACFEEIRRVLEREQVL